MGYNDKSYKAYSEFVGGQNSATASDNLTDNEVRICKNLDLVTRGALRTRSGTVSTTWACLANIGADKIPNKLAEFSTTNGTLIQLVLIDGNLLRRDSTTPLLTGCGTYLDFTVYNNKMYMFIKNSYYTYDGTTITEVTNGQTDSQLATIKKCKYIVARGERVFCSGNPDSPNSLYFSQIGDPTYFKTGSFVVQAASSDGDYITGLAEFNENILVFKTRGIWAWMGYNIAEDVKFVRLNVHTGTMHDRSITNVNSMLFFLGEDGVYGMRTAYSGGIDTFKASTTIDDIFKNMTSDKAFNGTAVGLYAQGKYYLCFTSKNGTLNNRMVVCHAEAGSDFKTLPWTVYEGISASAILKSGDGTVYFGSVAGKDIFTFSETAFDDRGTPFTYEVETKDYDMGSPIHLKKFKMLWVRVNQDVTFNTTFDLTVKIDYAEITKPTILASEGLVWDDGSWDINRWSWIDTITKVFKLSDKGLRCSVNLKGVSNATNKNRLFLYGVAFQYKAKKPYKEREDL